MLGNTVYASALRQPCSARRWNQLMQVRPGHMQVRVSKPAMQAILHGVWKASQIDRAQTVPAACVSAESGVVRIPALGQQA